jgi:hypothetical protein
MAAAARPAAVAARGAAAAAGAAAAGAAAAGAGAAVAAGAAVFTWAALSMAIMLITPICDAIHQLEADKPLLSWLLPTWVMLIRHVRAFEEQHADSDTVAGEASSILEIVQKRMDNHYDNSWAASHLLDPMFAQQGEQGWYMLKGRGDMLPARVVAHALACLKELAGAGNEAAVQAEFTRLKLAPLPPDMAADLPELTKRTQKDGGGVVVAPAEMRRGWWDLHSTHFPLIASAAIKLLSFHATSCASERNWSVWGRLCTKTTNRRVLERAEKLVTIMTSGTGAAPAADAEQDLLTLLAEPEPE